MKRLLILIAIALTAVPALFAQTPVEALRYSYLRPGGTARGLGLAGAMGAIGGDQTAFNINPAGIGIYRRSEAMFTAHLLHAGTTSTLEGNETSDSKFNLNVGNLGVVFAKVFEDASGAHTRGKWESIGIGIGYNRLANFHGRRLASNMNTFNSILGDYRNELNAGGLTPDMVTADNFSFGTTAAWDTYLLNPTDSFGTQYSAVTDGRPVDQQIQVLTKGSIDELALTIGANYNNKFYFGGSIGLPFLNYTEEVIIKETDLLDTIPAFNQFRQETDLTTSGIGINVKLGIMVRPVKWWRAGIAFHSPNFYAVEDNYATRISSEFDTIPYSVNEYTGEFAYSFNSPFRAIASNAFFFKQYGFLSVDYEYANYGNAKYVFPAGYGDAQDGINTQVDNVLNPTHTIRVGAEGAIQKFRLRSGFAYTTPPLDKSVVIGDADYSSMTFSGGLGYRAKWWYVDVTYFRTKTNTAGQFASNVVATNKIKQDNYLFTVGFTF